MNWNNITLGMYQQIDAVNKTDMEDIDKVLHTACIIFGKTEYEMNNEKPERAVKMINQVNKIFSLPLQATAPSRIGRYDINYDISSITLGQYVELTFFIADDSEKHAHRILASMATKRLRKGNQPDHRTKADYFLQQPVEKVVGAARAIIENYELFNSQYKALFGNDTEVTTNANDNGFNKRWGWIYSSTQVAAHEGIDLDKAYGLPIIQAFNDLMYLKAKNKYDMEQLRKSPTTNT